MTKNEIIAQLKDKGIEVKNASKLKLADVQAMLDEANATKTKKVRKVGPNLDQADPKFNMYFAALPKVIRDTVLKRNLDPRRLYNEYRKMGRDHMLSTYAPAAA